jgi:hypothetical protein
MVHLMLTSRMKISVLILILKKVNFKSASNTGCFIPPGRSPKSQDGRKVFISPIPRLLSGIWVQLPSRLKTPVTNRNFSFYLPMPILKNPNPADCFFNPVSSINQTAAEKIFPAAPTFFISNPSLFISIKTAGSDCWYLQKSGRTSAMHLVLQ